MLIGAVEWLSVNWATSLHRTL